MSNFVRSIFGLGLAAVLVVGCHTQAGSSGMKPSGRVSPAPIAAPLLPEFKVKTLDGQEVALASFRGQVVILDLFASWCPPCRMEIPQFVAMQKEHAGHLRVIGLSYDQGSVADLRKFLASMKVNYDVFWGSEEIANYVNLRGIPTTLVLDPQGRVQRRYVGFTDRSVFEADVRALSAAPPKP